MRRDCREEDDQKEQGRPRDGGRDADGISETGIQLTGEALEDADEGDDVLIGKLEGIVDLELGRLLVVEAPSELEGGSKGADIERAKQRIDDFSPGLLVAGDTTAAALLMKTSGEFFTIHAPVDSAMSALSKGVDVVFCGTRESVDRMVDSVTQLKRSTGYDITWKSYKA